MTRQISFAVAALLFSGVVAQPAPGYTNAPIPFDSTLDCASCIRGGYNWCLTIGGEANNTVTQIVCQKEDRDPQQQVNDNDPSGIAGGYVCSRAEKDQMVAIVGGCRPYALQNVNDDCGSYFVDLSEKSDFSVGRSVIDLPVNSSCVYRATSRCGVPQVYWRVNDELIAEDFDLAYASMDGLPPSDELDRWLFTQQTDHRGSVASNKSQEYQNVRQPVPGNLTISNEQWDKCNGINRNLWMVVTRVKDSDPQGLKRAARQLQFYPNGTKFADIDITFSNWRPASGASFIKYVTMAFVAGVAALAF